MTTQESHAWVYRGIWRALVTWFRVPDEPPTLGSDDDQPERFKPALAFLRYLKLGFWIICLLIDIAIVIGWIVITFVDWRIGLALLPVALVIAIVPDIIAYVALHLRYDTTWYVMTDRALRIRRGVWVIREMTISFENVQNISVSQGPLQRAFGIASLVVETAGSGGATGKNKQLGGGMNQGLIEGVADAQRLREIILIRLRQSKSSGLGDVDDRPDSQWETVQWSAAHLQALRDIRDAVHALRGTVL